jgi:hypothetical protein
MSAILTGVGRGGEVRAHHARVCACVEITAIVRSVDVLGHGGEGGCSARSWGVEGIAEEWPGGGESSWNHLAQN